jgi:hypothetical protein
VEDFLGAFLAFLSLGGVFSPVDISDPLAGAFDAGACCVFAEVEIIVAG